MIAPSDPVEIPIPAGLHRRLERHRHRIAAVRAAWRRFARHRFGVVGIAWVGVLVVVALFPDVFALHPPTWSVCHLASGPAPHPPAFGAVTGDEFVAPLGTDVLCRPVYSQLVWGTRRSLSIALGTAAIAGAVGGSLGLISGFYSDTTIDLVVQRGADLALSIPLYGAVLFLLVEYRFTALVLTLAFGLKLWSYHAATIRAEVAAIAERTYVEAATVSGGSDTYVLARHVLPSVAPLGAIYFARTAALALVAHFDVIVILMIRGQFGPGSTLSGRLFSTSSQAFVPTWSQVFGILAIRTGQSTGSVTLPPFVPWIVVPPLVLVVLTAAAFYFVSYSLEDLGESGGRSGGAGGQVGAESEASTPLVRTRPVELPGAAAVGRLLRSGRATISRGRAATGLVPAELLFVGIVLTGAVVGTGVVTDRASDLRGTAAGEAVDRNVEGRIVEVDLEDGELTVALAIHNPTEYPVHVGGGFVTAANETEGNLLFDQTDGADPRHVPPGSNETITFRKELSTSQRRQLRAAIRSGPLTVELRASLTAEEGFLRSRSEGTSRSFETVLDRERSDRRTRRPDALIVIGTIIFDSP